MGLDDVDFRAGLQFNQTALALQAAIDGHGVALVSGILVNDDLMAGRLIRPFDVRYETRFTYYLVYPEHALERENVRSFRDWIIAAAG